MSGNGRRPVAAARALARTIGTIAAGALAGVSLAAAPSAQALTIRATFDSSITSRSNAAQIESDFNTVAQFYQSNLSSPVTVYVQVSWGTVAGSTVGGLGASVDNLYGFYSYGQIKTALSNAANGVGNTALATAVGHLPGSDPGGVSQYAVPYAEAKALGLIPANQMGYDGYIGFSNSAAFDFNPADGIGSTTYDFEAVAAHELDEVLGRISGLTGLSPSYRTPMDLFRYSAPGTLGFTYKTPAYFSIDGGVTRLGDFNSRSGDQSDWLNATTGVGDVQAATGVKGKTAAITVADLTLLDVMGWAGSNPGDTAVGTPLMGVRSFMNVPEPRVWAMLALGFGLIGASLRRRQRLAPALVRARRRR
jgi:hypothetical protein